MSFDQVILATMGALMLIVIICLGLVYRDRRRAQRRLTDILADARRVES